MNHIEIREGFYKFFEIKNHKRINSASLLPSDPTVLFTTAGMQQFKPYYTNQADAQKDFGSVNTVSIQKCLRTSDIDDVGDESHLTFFEMMGNFSFGGYFKKEAIQYGYNFITKELGLKIDYVSVFGGDDDVPADDESVAIWKSIDKDIEIRKTSRDETFWGPTGEEGPCGPTSEIYVNGVEIWNLVFNQYYQHKDKRLEPLKTPGIDTGMGLERLAAISQNVSNAYDTDLLKPLIDLIPVNDIRKKRIIADHSRAVSFLICEGVSPSNKERGYVLRRLLRRLIVYSRNFSIENIFKTIEKIYGNYYSELDSQKVMDEFKNEEEKFKLSMDRGLRELESMDTVDSKSGFMLYESYGLPFEIIKEMAGDKAIKLNREEFDEKFKEHQELSRAGVEKKFGGHGIVKGDLTAASEEEMNIKIKLHTATHLLHSSLRKVLGNDVGQAGSDINAERLRFDFTFPRKLTEEELEKIEKLVNDTIQSDLNVAFKEMSLDEALKSGALAFFKYKYPSVVNVYTIGDADNAFSREICGGPHVSRTSEIGKFKIIKEESVSAGVRRIKATIDFSK